MAEIADNGGGGHDKGGKKRPKKGSTRIDMTPMVDLGFLLLTFFVMTTTFSKPKVMSLVYPPKTEEPIENPPKVNNGITFLLTKDKIYYYTGQFYGPGNKEGKPLTQLEETTFGPDGVRKLLAGLNSYVISNKKGLDQKYNAKSIDEKKYKDMLSKLQTDREALKVLIKTDDKATCENFVNLIDELEIAQVGVIAPVDLIVAELDLMKAKK
jgi:biopolymer transport protein ExbD